MTFLLRADQLLRAGPWATETERLWRAMALLLGFIALFGMTYGAVMGAFGGFFGDRLWQIFFSAVKVPILLLATFVISLPSFFVLNSLFGLRDDFVQAVRALVATQAGLAIILAALAPFTVLWYASSIDYTTAVMFNAVMFGTASVTAQWLLRRYYEPLIRRNRCHRLLLWFWVIIYAFVGIQMAWVLRPFIGSPDLTVTFFRQDPWDNAYLVVLRSLWQIVSNWW